jgi:hypothetical protein
MVHFASYTFNGLPVHFTIKLIADPASTFAPGGGSCPTMMEAGDGLPGMSGPGMSEFSTDAGAVTAIVTLPTENPASRSVLVTVPSGCPTKLGITNAAAESACAIRRLTLGAETLGAFAGGFCPAT